MPIRKENRGRYPKNWKTVVVPRIRARSGNRCECTGQCGQHPGLRCAWTHLALKENAQGRDVCVVLTVMHLNHHPEDCVDENLLHACQGCHNRYDAPMRAAGIKERARAKRAAGDLFEEGKSQ
jgi:hypothetical protein